MRQILIVKDLFKYGHYYASHLKHFIPSFRTATLRYAPQPFLRHPGFR